MTTTTTAPDARLDVNWWASAACATVGGDLWFPKVGAPADDAKLVCRGCPVRVECLEYAVSRPELEGVWGGASYRERRDLRAARQGR